MGDQVQMKLNISYPATGCQKVFEVDDEQKIKHFYDKRMAQEVPADHLGDEWKGYVFRVTGGNDKQGFPMKQGILNHGRVRLLLSKGHSCYKPGRTGGRKRKSVRGCIVNHNLSILNLAIVKKGEGEIEGLTDKQIPRRLGPKRANNIRKLFALDKSDPVTQYVIRKAVEKNGKTKSVAPKIQRLITPVTLNANAEEWLTRDHVLNKPRRPKLSTESSLPNVPRTPRKRRRNEDDHPSPNLLILLAQTDLITHASFRT